MMRKRVFGLCVLIMSVFVLTACGGQNLDGTYYRTFNASNNMGATIDDESVIKIDGNKGKKVDEARIFPSLFLRFCVYLCLICIVF